MTTTAERVVFVGQDDTRVETFTCDPPASDQVLIRNRVTLVSSGTELAVLRRRHRAYTTGGAMADWIAYPFLPGYAAVGEIVAVGDGVEDFAVGDVVWHAGNHATHRLVKSVDCKKIPAGVAPEDAVFFGLVQIAMTALHRAPTKLGDRVLVSGQGLVGMLCARLFALHGATVSVADLSSRRLERNATFGFRESIDLSTTSLESWYSTAERPAMVIEAAGVESNIDACIKIAERLGRVVLLGSPRKAMEIDPYNDVHLKGLSVIGAHESTVSVAVREGHQRVLFELCGGPLHLESIRSHMVSFREAVAVYDSLDSDTDNYLAVVLTYDDVT